ncbi:MAG: site-specific DNA-methyltransferase [Puniceicoccales bacterium]|jgi:site-specific DNA-methyltransferase (adenine-specific)|nr:site-specific DNA-methyltransferase [Puniceicoccales bacterium]
MTPASLSLFPETELQIGRRLHPAPNASDTPTLYYSHPAGELWQGDCVKWLATLPDASVDVVFADPPYNIKKAEWDVFENQEKYIAFSLQWVEQAARVLKNSGTLFICGFSEILADIKHPASKFFNSCRWLVWHYKNKANLGSDWGRSHESILHFRKSKKFTFNIDEIRIPYNGHTLKYPSHPQAETSQYGKDRNGHLWTPNPLGAKPKDVLEIPQDLLEIPTTCNGMNEKTPHPTQKPEELLRKLILATSNSGDLVIDPFCGSGTTAVCAQQLGRLWKACDLSAEYLSWAANRLEQVHPRFVEDWKNQDIENQKRRNSIR